MKSESLIGCAPLTGTSLHPNRLLEEEVQYDILLKHEEAMKALQNNRCRVTKTVTRLLFLLFFPFELQMKGSNDSTDVSQSADIGKKLSVLSRFCVFKLHSV